jgi:hypothetical protein
MGRLGGATIEPVPPEKPAWTPKREVLAANVRHLRRLLDQKSPSRFDGVRDLQQAAQRLCPTLTGVEALQAVINLAAEHPLVSRWGLSLRHLYGLTPESKGCKLGARRRLAFDASGEGSMETFRTSREEEMAQNVADAIIELVKEHQAGIRRIGSLTIRALNGDEIAAAKPLSNALIRELQAVFTYGVEVTVATGRTPRIERMAAIVFGQSYGTALEQVEELLRLVIRESEGDPMRREGILILAGLGTIREAGLGARRIRAAPYLGFPSGFIMNWTREGAGQALITRLKEPLLTLAIQEGIT